jgi:CheY-like chemotaxis protein
MRRHKILVVDDEVPNLRLLRRVLSEEHDIIEAQSGAEGLEVLKKRVHQPDYHRPTHAKHDWRAAS